MKKIIFLFITTILISNVVTSQIKIIPNGNVGFGSETTPTSKLELGNNEWLRFNVTYNKAGILFYETQGSSASDVQYGARIFYNEDKDGLYIVAKQNYVDNLGIFINRTYGKVGIRMANPTYSLDINGDTRTSGVYYPSDSNFKKNIESISKKKIDNLYQLKGKTYQLNFQKLNEINSSQKIVSDSSIISENSLSDSEELIQNSTSENSNTINKYNDFDEDKIHIGFVAQELQEFYPELVSKDNQGYLSIDYISLIPVLIEAIKELKGEIDELKAEKYKLKSIADLNFENNSIQN